MSAPPAEIELLEDVGRRAWPAAHALVHDGWLLCHSGGGPRRSGCVYPDGRGSGDLADRISFCERFYAERNARCVFKLTPASQPSTLETELERSGYTRSDETRVQTASLSRWKGREADPGVLISDHSDASWSKRCIELAGATGRNAEAHARILDRVAARRGPSAFARIEREGTILAMGLGAIEGRFLFMGEIVTDAGHRRAGLGRVLVESLLIWGRDAGADQVLLQVVADNRPALELYDALGFVTRYSYWYREAPYGASA